MKTLILEGGNMDYLWLMIIVIIVIMLLPAIILTIIGYNLRKKKPQTSKILFIIAAVYVIVGLGICGVMSF